MKKIIIAIFLILMAASAFAQVDHYFKLTISYDNGNLSLKKIKASPLEETLPNTEGRYIAEVVSFQNEILNLTYFSIPTYVFFDFQDNETGAVGGGVSDLNQTEVEFYVPYYPDAKEINIYDWDLNKKLTVDVSSYAKEFPETLITKEPEVSKESEKPVQKTIEEVKSSLKEKNISDVLAGVGFGIVLFLIMIIILLIIIKKMKR